MLLSTTEMMLESQALGTVKMESLMLFISSSSSKIYLEVARAFCPRIPRKALSIPRIRTHDDPVGRHGEAGHRWLVVTLQLVSRKRYTPHAERGTARKTVLLNTVP